MLDYIDFSGCTSIEDIIDVRLTGNNIHKNIMLSKTVVEAVLDGFEAFYDEVCQILCRDDINEEISEITDNLLIHAADKYIDVIKLLKLPDISVYDLQQPITELIDMICKVTIELNDICISNDEYII